MAEKLYYGGTILTMEENIYTEAVLTDNGKIKAVGTLEELKARSKGKAEFIHLDGNTMLPGLSLIHILILIAWAFVLAALFFVSYFNTSRRCQWMRYQLDGLDQKYLVLSLIHI